MTDGVAPTPRRTLFQRREGGRRPVSRGGPGSVHSGEEQPEHPSGLSGLTGTERSGAEDFAE